ncbi:unnamed protein product [Rhizoctonia solani]|uniref:Uncharacterized protein n=1 Tax=Rhizoctonia solani TaxID=456999 RepID=A0A8H2X8A5_9AGAM|nr:unnamed protein product [Rhizoctonia solani]
MGRTKSARSQQQTATWADMITPQTFEGLNIDSNGLELITRNVPLPKGTQYECRQKTNRETLKKTEHNMTRALLREVSTALGNKVELPFRISEFEKARDKGIPLEGTGPFKELARNPTRLTRDKGPRVVTDLDGIPILWYFPTFIGNGLQTNLLRCISDIAQVYRPPKDADIKDRRAGPKQSGQPAQSSHSTRYVTRSHTAQLATATVEEPLHEQEREAEFMHGSVCVVEQPPSILDDQLPPETYKESEGEDGAKGIRPIQMSSQFRNALSSALSPTIRFLEAKRLLDKKITRLTDIIQPSLSKSMCELRAQMSAVKGPTQVAVINGWTSAFPCYGVAINRVTGMHRDQGGFRGGLDVIGVLGTFDRGGDLDLPDLNLRLEWTPGCLGAFDGYDFRHMVHEWSGGSRVTLISFCRKSTWDGLHLKPTITRPHISECQGLLSTAIEERNAAVKEDCKNRAVQRDNKPFRTRPNESPPGPRERESGTRHFYKSRGESQSERKEGCDPKRRRLDNVLDHS